VKSIVYVCIMMMVAGLLGCDSDDGSCNDPAGERSFRFGTHSDATGSEDFIAITDDPELIAAIEAELLYPPEERFFHIHGRIAKGNGGYNLDWSWHFVPGEWNLAEMSIELCDGTPSYVEGNLDDWLAMQDSFCPWDSYVKEEVLEE
jgi:hypothetical protein